MANPLTSMNAIETDRMPPELPTRVTSEGVIYPLMTAAPLLLEDERAVKAAQTAIDAGHKVIAIFGALKESDSQGSEKDLRREFLYPVGTAIDIAR